jgi:hypothetical protein
MLLASGVAHGQQAALNPPRVSFDSAAIEPSTSSRSFLPETPKPHQFWDRKNRLLFSAAAAFSFGDFAVTRMNLGSGGRELNPMVQPFTGSTAALASNFAGQTAGVVAVSYLFHRSAHHRLERWAPVANIAASAFAVSYGLAHR